MLMQRNLPTRCDEITGPVAAVQRGVLEAVIQDHENGRTPNQSFAARVSDVSHADKAAGRRRSALAHLTPRSWHTGCASKHTTERRRRTTSAFNRGSPVGQLLWVRDVGLHSCPCGGRKTSAGRRDVGIDPEEIVRIVLPLDRCQPRIIVSERGSDDFLALFARHMIHVGCPRGHRL